MQFDVAVVVPAGHLRRLLLRRAETGIHPLDGGIHLLHGVQVRPCRSVPRAGRVRLAPRRVGEKARRVDTPTGDRLCKPLLIDRLAKIVREPIPLHTTGAPELVECAASRRIAGGELLHHHFRRYLQPRADQADGGVREVVMPGVRVLRVCKLHLFAGVQVNDGPRPQLDAALVGVVDQLLRRYHFSKRSAVRRVL